MRSTTTAPAVERLILDLGGVVLPSAMPQVVAELAAHSRKTDQQLWRYFNRHLFGPFWSGQMGLEEFWRAFATYADVPDMVGRWQTEMTASMLRPLEHLEAVRGWTRTVPVGVLSNQRAEWVLPVLARAGLADVLDPLLVSSLTGLVKPDPRAFAQLTRLGTPPDRVLYVDDRPQALRAAEQFGIATIQAHNGDQWVARVSARLGLCGHRRRRLTRRAGRDQPGPGHCGCFTASVAPGDPSP